MKKIIYICCIILLTLNSASAKEKNECSDLKKFSKEHLFCKANQLKEGVKNFSFSDDIKIDGKSVKEIIKKK